MPRHKETCGYDTASKLAPQASRLVPMLLGEKIKLLMEARGWGPVETARQVSAAGPIEVSYQLIQQLLDDPKRRPRYIIQLARAFDMTAEELEAWTPDMLNRPMSSRVRAAEKPANPYLRTIVTWNDPSDLPPEQYVLFRRLDTRLSAGPGGPAAEDIEEYEAGASFRADYAARKGWRRETHYTMRADGESMDPTIQHNAPVVVATNEREIRSGRIYAIKLDPDSQPILKRLDKLPGGRLRVRSDNPSPAYAPFEVQMNEVKVIGRAVWTAIEL